MDHANAGTTTGGPVTSPIMPRIVATPHRMMPAHEVDAMAAIARTDVDGFSMRGQRCRNGRIGGNASCGGGAAAPPVASPGRYARTSANRQTLALQLRRIRNKTVLFLPPAPELQYTRNKRYGQSKPCFFLPPALGSSAGAIVHFALSAIRSDYLCLWYKG